MLDQPMTRREHLKAMMAAMASAVVPGAVVTAPVYGPSPLTAALPALETMWSLDNIPLPIVHSDFFYGLFTIYHSQDWDKYMNDELGPVENLRTLRQRILDLMNDPVACGQEVQNKWIEGQE